ncbi:MAG: helix-turn-helix domain-containing protein [Flavobacteriaceae bacterium]|jgi:AraC-like DNA-binding protein|nr:helix-turn-helix domain-containing protein [Flavobacteriaceae bacterium]
MTSLNLTKTKQDNKDSVENALLQQFDIFTLQEDSKNVTPNRSKTHYKISYVESDCKMFYGAITKELKGPMLFFSSSTTPFSLDINMENQNGFVCYFNNNFLGFKGNVLKNALNHLKNNPIYGLTPEQDMLISYLFQKMREESQGSFEERFEIIRNYIEIIIHQANRFNILFQYKGEKKAANRLCSQFLELLERQFPITNKKDIVKMRTPQDFAQVLEVHTNHLNFTLNNILGKNTSSIIQTRILLEAKELLKTPNWSVSEIAYCLGFEYPTYFSSFFKKNTGMTPNEFRKHLK